MDDDEPMSDWHSTQNAAYLELSESRLKEPRLLWVDQFIDILNEELRQGVLAGRTSMSLNDYGCNVGHFFRGIADLNCAVEYRGFDISATYLAIAQRAFGSDYFHRLDIAQTPKDPLLAPSDVAVISATLEHIENIDDALTNIFSQTREIVILRTFVGETSRKDMCRTIGAASEFLCRQFTIPELTRLPAELGWKYREETDRATMGEVKMVCNNSSIPRAQGVVIFTKF